MMDVPVSRLNNRLAVQLPAELPLGLVFVVGHVEQLHQADAGVWEGNRKRTWFDLVEKTYRIRCELSERAAAEVRLGEGARIRAGGHLVFDAHRANYYLLARDIETVSEAPQAAPLLETNGHGVTHAIGRQALTPILADIKRRAEYTHLEEASLPYWVQRLAPPEVKREMGLLEPAPRPTAESPATATMDDDLVSVLSQAMDSDEEVELTAEMLAKLSPRAARRQPPSSRNNPYRAPAATVTLPSEQQNIIVPLILLIFAVILVIVLLAFLVT